MKLNFKHNTKLRVRYGETDQMGYCYYGNYAQYFEVGRVETLRSLGMSYKSLEDRGVMLPVSHFEIDYKSPAIYDDELTVSTSIVEVIGSRIIFDYVITKEERIVAIASTTLVFVSKVKMKPIQPPTEFIELIRDYLI